MRESTAEYMCTSNCPCPYDTDFGKWTETQLNEYNRTKEARIGYVQMIKAGSANSSTAYDNFWDCY